MIDDPSADPLFERGWERDREALVWKGAHGTSIQLESSDRNVRVAVFFDGQQVLGYDIRVDPARFSELVTALANATNDLDALHHAPFSKAVAGIAEEAIVKTTDGARVRPALENGELVWKPVEE